MGNAALSRVPQDLTKCSKPQLQAMINSVIINNPWNEEDENEEDALTSTVDIMKNKGFRPITPEEFVLALKAARKLKPVAPGTQSSATSGVKVWVPINSPSKDFVATQAKEAKNTTSDSSAASSSSFISRMTYGSSQSSSNASSSNTSKNRTIEEIFLPESPQEAAQEILRSGASDAEISELCAHDTGSSGAMEVEADLDLESLETEEWPTYGSPAKYHLNHLQHK
jgi:hypothetical protein